jgi:hypothetical protein
MTMELYDFGAEVDVTLPDRDDVTSFEELMKMAEGS